jgi:ABC-2 type transport system ATP-binding protein
MATVVSTDRLTKDFKTGVWRPRIHRGLDALTLEIPAGGVFGLLGPNGAGKSTTLKLLLHLLKPTSGHAEIFGLPPGDVRAHQRLGFLPENPAFYDYLSAEELLVYFAGLCGSSSADARAKAAAMLDLVGIAADRRRPLRQYSKGMIQRVGIAQALVNEPELVILDEPMSGLDPVGRREVRELIMKLRDQGRTVLFSSHILSDAELLCTRVGILAKGKLVASGGLADLTSAGTRGNEVVATGVTWRRISRLSVRG